MSKGLMSRCWSVFGVAPFILAALLTFGPAGFAQNKKKGEDLMRTVQGTVSAAGDAGAPVVGAVVYLKNLKNLQIRSFITQQNGTYYFHGLSTDVDYELRAKSNDMESSARTLSSFDSRTDAVLNLKLDKKVEKK